MTHEQREEYIRRVKRSFKYDASEYRPYRSDLKTTKYNDCDENERPFGFWKIRVIIAVIIFAGIFSLYHSKSQDNMISFDKITSVVEKEFNTQTITTWMEQE